MLLICGTRLMTEQQQADWAALLDRLADRQVAAPVDDPLLFHGTSQARAEAILSGGFDPGTSWVSTRERSGGPGGPAPCVFWTNDVAMAAKFASNKSGFDEGFPVILMARLSDVLASGTPVPDRNTWICDTDEDPELEPHGWRDSLETLRAIAVLGCRRVENLEADSIVPWGVRPDPAVGYAWAEEWNREGQLLRAGADRGTPAAAP
jgi:hypothetical protein